MKALRILFAFALLTAMPVIGSAADKSAMVEHPVYKADLSGVKIPGVTTTATGEAVFLPTGPVMSGAAGAGTGGVSSDITGDVDMMSDVGTSVPGDNTGQSGPGQGFDQGGMGQAYEGIVNSDVNNTGSALNGTELGYWGMLDDRSNQMASVTEGREITGVGAGGTTKGKGTPLKPDSVAYLLSASDIRDVTAAHLHMGKPGTEGPVIAPLFLGPKKSGDFSGLLAEGTISSADLAGPLAGKTIDDLVKLIKSGDVYVNVHTDSHPAGEISGALKKVS